MNKAVKNLMQKTKMEKILKTNQKSLAEFFSALIIAMYFQILDEKQHKANKRTLPCYN